MFNLVSYSGNDIEFEEPPRRDEKKPLMDEHVIAICCTFMDCLKNYLIISLLKKVRPGKNMYGEMAGRI